MVEPGAFIGQLVDGRWLLLDHLGSGAFGDVYSAEPRHLRLATGAVKIVRPRTPAERAQILAEIRALTDLSHDCLLGYRDSGEVHEGVLAGGIYIVTELCDRALSDEPGWATGGVEFGAELATAVAQIAGGLEYLHERGFVHRDIKPSNILRSGEQWKLSDFGLVHHQSEPARHFGPQGTAPYSAPETTTASRSGFVNWLGDARPDSAHPLTASETSPLTKPIPSSAIDATAPTSRSTFRLLAGCVDATNREADMLRRALLAQWADRAGPDDLVDRLQELDGADPDGAQGVESRLAVWFSFADPGDGRLVTDGDPVLTGLSSELRNRLAGTSRPVPD